VKSPKGAAARSYITPAGAKRLRAELDQLWTIERPRVTQEVADAAAQGDRSENAEYIYGKRRLREIDRRVRFLSKRLDQLVVVTETPKDATRVFFGAWVTLEDDDGDSVTYRIVGSDELDLDAGCISIDSPVARALLGKRDGDEVTVRRPKGEATYTIVGVRYE
jgi:transcription elongation factor GreB